MPSIRRIRFIRGFAGKPGHVDPDTLSDLAAYTLATAMSRPAGLVAR